MTADEYKAACRRLKIGPNEAVTRLGIAQRIHFACQSGERSVARRTAEVLRLIDARPELLHVQIGAAP
jgi:hypothetical protein